MMAMESRNDSWKVTLIALIVTLLLGLLIASAARGEEPPSRLDRKVRVMERVLHEVLVQSEHVRVGMGGGTTGVVLEEYGAVFMFHGELGGEIEHMPDMQHLLQQIEEREDEDDAEANPADKGRSSRGKGLAELRKEAQARRTGELAALREELVDTLIDYGPTLGELGDDRWVVIVGVLDGGIFSDFQPDREVRLVLKAKLRDLRQLAAGGITRQAMAAKVSVQEQ